MAASSSNPSRSNFDLLNRKEYILNNSQTPFNSSLKPYEIVNLWVQLYAGLPHTDDNGKFIWAYIINDVMNASNPFYQSIREHRLMYIGPTQPFKESLWKNVSRNTSDLNFTTRSPGVIDQIQPVAKITDDGKEN